MSLRGRLVGLTRTDVYRPDLIGPGQSLEGSRVGALRPDVFICESS